jgi:hypothetical protein
VCDEAPLAFVRWVVPALRAGQDGLEVMLDLMVSEVLRDSPFTTFARSTLGGVVLVIAAVAALVVLVAWVSRPRHTDRRVAAAAAVCAPALLVLLNVILGKRGVWQSTLYTLPPVALVSTTVLFVAAVTVMMLLILSGYRAAASRGRRAALMYSLLLVVIVAALIVLVDTVALTEHYVAFGHGYTIWMDVVVGVVTLGLPVLVLELLQRRSPSDKGGSSG